MIKNNLKSTDKYSIDKYLSSGVFYNIDELGAHDIVFVSRSNHTCFMMLSGKAACKGVETELDLILKTEGKEKKTEIEKDTNTISIEDALRMIAITKGEKYKDTVL